MTKTCPICGEPTNCYMGNYRKDGLCREHARELKEGRIYLCEKCGKWHETGKSCEKRAAKVSEDHHGRTKCILCEAETENGYLFCRSCYAKYSDKIITVQIDHCSRFEIIDGYGNKTIKTKSGLYVRSQQEKIIYDELYDRNIRVEYEKIVRYRDDNGEEKEMKPDFYLPDYKLYIEHWGYESAGDPGYIKQKEYKERIYKKLGLKVAGTNTKDIQDIHDAIERIFFNFGIPTD